MRALSQKSQMIMAAFLCAAMMSTFLPLHAYPARFRPLAGVSGLTIIEDNAVPLAKSVVLKPETGGSTATGGGATLDYSNAAEGYVMVKYTGNNKKVKLLITKSGKTQYQFNLTPGGKFETFPLTQGNGSYAIGVYTNVSGSQYAPALEKKIDVKLKNANSPFLYPSQFVNFTAASKTVVKANELSKGAANDLKVVENVYNYVIGNTTYDTGLAAKVTGGAVNGYIPKLDSVLAAKKGICFDYAAVMTAMLRSQQIPTRMEFGYVSNGAYHAWISTYIKDVGWVDGAIQFDGKNWKRMDPTFASSGGSSSSILQYIGSGSNYKTQFIY